MVRLVSKLSRVCSEYSRRATLTEDKTFATPWSIASYTDCCRSNSNCNSFITESARLTCSTILPSPSLVAVLTAATPSGEEASPALASLNAFPTLDTSTRKDFSALQVSSHPTAAALNDQS